MSKVGVVWASFLQHLKEKRCQCMKKESVPGDCGLLFCGPPHSLPLFACKRETLSRTSLAGYSLCFIWSIKSYNFNPKSARNPSDLARKKCRFSELLVKTENIVLHGLQSITWDKRKHTFVLKFHSSCSMVVHAIELGNIHTLQANEERWEPLWTWQRPAKWKQVR